MTSRNCGTVETVTVYWAAIRQMVLAALLSGFASHHALAGPLPSGDKTITLVAHNGARQVIGRVAFTPDGDGAKIAVTLDAPQFSEEFLSMRPFRCLSGPQQMWCHLAYPYGTRARITASDLVDLEYQLMFLWRTPDRVGADAWNGLYFKLALAADGVIAGDLHEADYNPLAVPPTDAFARPIGHGDLSRAEPGRRLFDRVEIK